jgi:phosphoribosyl 1,2-cyclic phosphodiesterase
MSFDVTFWGVRGTIPCPSPSHMRFGGNTSCVEVTAGEHKLILDAGTGIRPLGKRLAAEGQKRMTLLLSHSHLDHISGFPFFAPAFNELCSFRVMAGHLKNGMDIHQVLAGQMKTPLFPVPIQNMRSNPLFIDFRPGDPIDLAPGLVVRTAPLNHPGGATGYRIEFDGRALAYVTDTEHVPGRPDPNVLGLIEGSDLVIYDATYTDEELPARVGWGHSTWQEGMRLCQSAGARQLALFHHDPDHDDAFLTQLEGDAQKVWPHLFFAREGSSVALS